MTSRPLSEAATDITTPAELAVLARLIRAMTLAEDRSARKLNAAGYSWEQIGAAQGISRQSAWRKYTSSARHVTRRARRGGKRPEGAARERNIA